MENKRENFVFFMPAAAGGKGQALIITGYKDQQTKDPNKPVISIPIKEKIPFGTPMLDGKFVTSNAKLAESIRDSEQFKSGMIIELDPTDPSQNVFNPRTATDAGKVELERSVLIEKAKRYGVDKDELKVLVNNLPLLRDRVEELQTELADKALSMARQSLDSVKDSVVADI